MLLRASEMTGGPSHPYKVGDQWAKGNKRLKNSLSESTRERWESDCEIKEKLQQDLPFQARRSGLLCCLIIVLGCFGWLEEPNHSGSDSRVLSTASLSSLQSLSHVQLFATPWTTSHQASLSITNSRSLLKLMSVESVMPSNHLILSRRLLLPPSIFPSLRDFPLNQFFASGGLSIGVWASTSVLPMNTQGLISFRKDWLDFLVVQGTLKSLFQHHSSKAAILWRSAFFIASLKLLETKFFVFRSPLLWIPSLQVKLSPSASYAFALPTSRGQTCHTWENIVSSSVCLILPSVSSQWDSCLSGMAPNLHFVCVSSFLYISST